MNKSQIKLATMFTFSMHHLLSWLHLISLQLHQQHPSLARLMPYHSYKQLKRLLSHTKMSHNLQTIWLFLKCFLFHSWFLLLFATLIKRSHLDMFMAICFTRIDSIAWLTASIDESNDFIHDSFGEVVDQIWTCFCQYLISFLRPDRVAKWGCSY